VTGDEVDDTQGWQTMPVQHEAVFVQAASTPKHDVVTEKPTQVPSNSCAPGGDIFW
jgi:hypothetical protein